MSELSRRDREWREKNVFFSPQLKMKGVSGLEKWGRLDAHFGYPLSSHSVLTKAKNLVTTEDE